MMTDICLTPLSDPGGYPWLTARVYPIDLLTRLPAIVNKLNNPPAFVCS